MEPGPGQIPEVKLSLFTHLLCPSPAPIPAWGQVTIPETEPPASLLSWPSRSSLAEGPCLETAAP